MRKTGRGEEVVYERGDEVRGWVVIRRRYRRGGGKYNRWLVECERCGVWRRVSGSHLKDGEIKGCEVCGIVRYNEVRRKEVKESKKEGRGRAGYQDGGWEFMEKLLENRFRGWERKRAWELKNEGRKGIEEVYRGAWSSRFVEEMNKREEEYRVGGGNQGKEIKREEREKLRVVVEMEVEGRIGRKNSKEYMVEKIKRVIEIVDESGGERMVSKEDLMGVLRGIGLRRYTLNLIMEELKEEGEVRVVRVKTIGNEGKEKELYTRIGRTKAKVWWGSMRERIPPIPFHF